MIIKNYNKITNTEFKKDLVDIIEDGIKKVNPHDMIRDAVRYNGDFNSVIIQHNEYDLFQGRIFVIGGGKAVGNMAHELEEIIGSDRIVAGIINTVKGRYNLKKIKVNEVAYPLPEKKGEKGAIKMMQLKDKYKIGQGDLVINLLSGGASAMVPAPVDGISIKDQQKITELLLESKAQTPEINIIRRHLSKIKGGRLAQFFYPAKVVSIIISNVIGDRLEVIGSGPTAPDHTSFQDAKDVLAGHNLWEKTPESIKNHILKGVSGEIEDTPSVLENAANHIIGNSSIVLEAMAVKAKNLGYKPIIVFDDLSGNSREGAKRVARDIIKKQALHNVFLFAGKTKIKTGKRDKDLSRNQQFVASLILEIKNIFSEWGVASLDTDGIDYHSQYAGTVLDHNILNKVKDFSELQDIKKTTNFFKKNKDTQILTGDTGTNVGDVVIFIKK